MGSAVAAQVWKAATGQEPPYNHPCLKLYEPGTAVPPAGAARHWPLQRANGATMQQQQQQQQMRRQSQQHKLSLHNNQLQWLHRPEAVTAVSSPQQQLQVVRPVALPAVNTPHSSSRGGRGSSRGGQPRNGAGSSRGGRTVRRSSRGAKPGNVAGSSRGCSSRGVRAGTSGRSSTGARAGTSRGCSSRGGRHGKATPSVVHSQTVGGTSPQGHTGGLLQRPAHVNGHAEDTEATVTDSDQCWSGRELCRVQQQGPPGKVIRKPANKGRRSSVSRRQQKKQKQQQQQQMPSGHSPYAAEVDDDDDDGDDDNDDDDDDSWSNDEIDDMAAVADRQQRNHRRQQEQHSQQLNQPQQESQQTVHVTDYNMVHHHTSVQYPDAAARSVSQSCHIQQQQQHHHHQQQQQQQQQQHHQQQQQQQQHRRQQHQQQASSLQRHQTTCPSFPAHALAGGCDNRIQVGQSRLEQGASNSLHCMSGPQPQHSVNSRAGHESPAADASVPAPLLYDTASTQGVSADLHPHQHGMPPGQRGMPPRQQGIPPRQHGMLPHQQGMPPRQHGMHVPQQGMPPRQQGMPPPPHGLYKTSAPSQQALGTHRSLPASQTVAAATCPNMPPTNHLAHALLPPPPPPRLHTPHDATDDVMPPMPQWPPSAAAAAATGGAPPRPFLPPQHITRNQHSYTAPALNNKQQQFTPGPSHDPYATSPPWQGLHDLPPNVTRPEVTGVPPSAPREHGPCSPPLARFVPDPTPQQHHSGYGRHTW
eukprot:jgi/Chrzof1/2655/Cz11g24030.t1